MNKLPLQHASQTMILTKPRSNILNHLKLTAKQSFPQFIYVSLEFLALLVYCLCMCTRACAHVCVCMYVCNRCVWMLIEACKSVRSPGPGGYEIHGDADNQTQFHSQPLSHRSGLPLVAFVRHFVIVTKRK